MQHIAAVEAGIVASTGYATAAEYFASDEFAAACSTYLNIFFQIILIVAISKIIFNFSFFFFLFSFFFSLIGSGHGADNKVKITSCYFGRTPVKM